MLIQGWFLLPLVSPVVELEIVSLGATHTTVSWIVHGNLTRLNLLCQVTADPGSATKVCLMLNRLYCRNSIVFLHFFVSFFLCVCVSWGAIVWVVDAKSHWNICYLTPPTRPECAALWTAGSGGNGPSPDPSKPVSTKHVYKQGSVMAYTRVWLCQSVIQLRQWSAEQIIQVPHINKLV